MNGRLAVACLLLVFGQSGVGAQAIRVDVRELLNDLAAYRLSLPPDQLRVTLSSALQDASADVRARALAAVAARAGAFRFSSKADAVAVWRLERPVLQALDAQVLVALDDPDGQVRHQAVLAIGNLQYEEGPDRGVGGLVLSAPVERALSGRFRKEPDATVRAEIAKAFVLTSTQSPDAVAVLALALADEADALRVFGLRGLRASHPVTAMRRVVDLLGSNSRAVRLEAAHLLQAYGTSVGAYGDELRLRLDRERDAAVAAALKQALRTAGLR